MKKLLLLALAAAAVASSQAAPAAHFSHKVLAGKTTASPRAGHRIARAQASGEAAAVWRPQSELLSVWEGEWFEYESYETTYTGGENALVATELCTNIEEGTRVLTTNTWNADNRLAQILVTTADEEGDFENSERTERTYDERVPSFITANYQWIWFEGWQQAGNNYTQTITRDAAGNITAIERAVFFQGIFDPTYRLAIEYTDGKASKITQSDLTYDYASGEYTWVESAVLDNIVWERTDGQITDIDDLYLGENRILSAHRADDDNDVEITAQYPAEGVVVVRHEGLVQGYEDSSMEINYTTLENGGYNQVTTYTTTEDGEEYSESYTDTETYDAYGHLTLLSSTWSSDGMSEVEQYVVGTVEYDQTYGYPLTYTVEYALFDEETEEMELTPDTRSEYSNYTDCAGVMEATVSEDDSPVYYNLNGMTVEPGRLAPGIYIVRRGTTATKQIVR